ncbi:MAG: hypothetical protein PHF86_02460 [Candidatus Nanoarchaeia archaeon]|nr:hypothetical protein [Candidatus Nanoarchaeia archaeon]
MSGGHYDYQYSQIDQLTDYIESDFINDGIYESEDWSFSGFGDKPKIKMDRLSDADPDQKEIILKEIKTLISDLKYCAKRAKELEWYMSGDTGAKTYLERLNKIIKL